MRGSGYFLICVLSVVVHAPAAASTDHAGPPAPLDESDVQEESGTALPTRFLDEGEVLPADESVGVQAWIEGLPPLLRFGGVGVAIGLAVPSVVMALGAAVFAAGSSNVPGFNWEPLRMCSFIALTGGGCLLGPSGTCGAGIGAVFGLSAEDKPMRPRLLGILAGPAALGASALGMTTSIFVLLLSGFGDSSYVAPAIAGVILSSILAVVSGPIALVAMGVIDGVVDGQEAKRTGRRVLELPLDGRRESALPTRVKVAGHTRY